MAGIRHQPSQTSQREQNHSISTQLQLQSGQKKQRKLTTA
jgi:hypothetical protein